MIRSRRLPHLLALAVLVLAGLALLGLLLLAGDDSGAAADNRTASAGEVGPLTEIGASTRTGAPIELDEPYSWGIPILTNSGDETVTVDGVTLVDQAEGVEMKVYAVPLAERKPIGIAEGYDDTGVRPAGLVLEPGDEYQLVFGLWAREPGEYLMPGVKVTYHSDDQRYETVLPQTVRICAPLTTYERCSVENL